MGAIGFAESSGISDNINRDSGACGLWQIHPAQPGCQDPMTNAQMAVQKYNTQGLKAWEAYTNGNYRQYYNASTGITTLSTRSDCQTYTVFGQCADGIVGIGAVGLGLSLIAIAIVVFVLHTPQGKEAAKLAALVVK